MLRRVLARSRYLILIAVIGTFLAAITMLVYGLLTVIFVMVDAFTHSGFTTVEARHISFEFIEMIDVFLLGTILYIVAVGLYQLFIDSKLPTPHWLEIADIDDLKARLLVVVLVLMVIAFLGEVVTWDGSLTIAALGGSVAVVVFAGAYMLGKAHETHPPESPHK
jgi:uncharacterized membrane protein YqhA